MTAAVTASPEGFPPQDLRSFLELCDGEWLALRSHFDLALVEEKAPDPAMTADGSAEEAAAFGPEAGAVAVSAGRGGGADDVAEPLPGERAGAAAGASVGSGAAPGVATDSGSDGLPDFAALLQQARAEVEEVPSEEAWHSSERAELLVAFLVPEQADQPGGLRVTPPGGGSRELYFRHDGSFAGAADQAPAGQWQLWPDGSLELILDAPGRVLRERIWFTQPNLRLRSSVEHLAGGVPGRARFSSEIRRVRKPAA
jgi:hypothetical protein